MIKRTVEVSSAPCSLHVHAEQLQIKRDGEIVGSVPLEDIGLLVIDERRSLISTHALERLLHHQAAVIICEGTHHPAGMMIPFVGHTNLQAKLDLQLNMSRPMRKRLWRQLVCAKIRAQARMLPDGTPSQSRMKAIAREVRSGDPENAEAQAARLYWKEWMGDESGFRRDQDGDGLNGMLNYGYAIIRATLARACVIAGLQPAIGIHHCNRSNAFCLVDDLIEPLRPIVDLRVRELQLAGKTQLSPSVKKELLELLTWTVRFDGQSSPLAVAIQNYVFGFVRCLEKNDAKMSFIRWASAGTVSCGS